jgi:hypothetical protein
MASQTIKSPPPMTAMLARAMINASKRCDRACLR